MKQFLSSVRKNVPVANGYNLLAFEWPSSIGLADPLPGQFVTIRSASSSDPLLRRPFAVSAFHASPGTCEIVYQIRGKGTQGLSACREGDHIDIIGPLGREFPVPNEGRRPYLLAGGIGFGPIYYLAGTLVKASGKPVTIFGARTADLIPEVSYSQLDSDGGELHFCTDDGSRGFHGTVTGKLEALEGLSADNGELYACGPGAMLAAVSEFSEKAGITCWVSVEQVMGCGVGACMGCAIRAREPGKFVRVCTEGPVFNAKDLSWS